MHPTQPVRRERNALIIQRGGLGPARAQAPRRTLQAGASPRVRRAPRRRALAVRPPARRRLGGAGAARAGRARPGGSQDAAHAAHVRPPPPRGTAPVTTLFDARTHPAAAPRHGRRSPDSADASAPGAGAGRMSPAASCPALAVRVRGGLGGAAAPGGRRAAASRLPGPPLHTFRWRRTDTALPNAPSTMPAASNPSARRGMKPPTGSSGRKGTACRARSSSRP